MTSSTIFTVGHSTHPIGEFIELLRRHEVSVVADVRSSPYSRYNPQYNREFLERSLRSEGIGYLFLGRELGPRVDDPGCYANGRVKYSRLAERPAFREGVERVAKGVKTHRIALMCAEKEPLECHRTLLVAQALAARGMCVDHIHADGSLEGHAQALERLPDMVGLPRHDLFLSKAEILTEALARQEERIAYRRPEPEPVE